MVEFLFSMSKVSGLIYNMRKKVVFIIVFESEGCFYLNNIKWMG